MSARTFAESTVEQTALSWLETVGWQIRNGAEIALGELIQRNRAFMPEAQEDWK